MFILSDRVKETSSTVGSGSVALNGAYGAFQSFNQGIGNGNETYYAIENNSRWEVGKGVYTSSSNSLSRDVVLNSSASGAKVNLEGISVVFCTLPASKATAKDLQGQVSLSGIIFSDSTVQTTAAVSTTTIVGISGTKAQFDTSVTDGNFLYIGDAPTSHTHGNITNAGAIGSTTDLPIVTTTSGVLTAGSFGTTAGTFAAGDDSRITGALSTSTAAVTYQPLDADLTSLAAASGSGIYERSGGNWTPVTIGTGLYLGSGTLSNTLDLSSYLTSSVASATYLPLAGGTLTGDLKFTDATYDIGKSGLTRPRDAFFSRNLSVGGSAYATTYYFQNTNLVISAAAAPYTMLFYTAGSVTCQMSSVGTTLLAGSTGSIGFASSSLGATTTTGDTLLFRDAAGTLAQRNSTNAQTFRLYNTYTSSTSFENLQFKSVAGAAYQIGSAIGSAGGSNRAIAIGHYDSAGTFAARLTIGTDGYTTGSRFQVDTGYGGYGYFNGKTLLALYGTSADPATLIAQSVYSTVTLSALGYGGSGYKTTTGDTYLSAVQSLGGTTFWIAQESAGANLAFVVGGTSTTYKVCNFTSSAMVLTPVAATSGSPTAFTLTGAAHTTLTLSTEATDVNFNLARTVQFATGALTTQRAMRIQAPTYSFVGASTITTASTLSISGPPVAGTNATITNKYALAIENNGILQLQNVSGYEVGVPRILISLGSPYVGLGDASFVVKGDGYCYSYAGFDVATTSSIGIQTHLITFQGGWGNIKRASPNLNGNGNHFSSAYNIGLIPTSGYGVQIINGTNANKLQVYTTFTSTTSYETLNIKGKASANFEIGPENGSAGGTLRGLTLGCYPAGAATIVGWAQFRPNASTGALEAFYLGPIADSTAVGGNARGTNSIDLQMYRSAATQVASGSYSVICGGSNNAASGYAAVVLGGSSNAAGNYNSTVINGDYNSSGGYASTVVAGSRATANLSGQLIVGYGGRPFGGQNLSGGIAQWSVAILSNLTTDSTPIALTLGTSGSGSSNFTVRSGYMLFCKVMISGIKSDGSAAACYMRKVAIKNVGGTTSLVGTVETIGTDIEDNPATDVAITANNTSDILEITVTGIAAETWRWIAVVEHVEMAYGT